VRSTADEAFRSSPATPCLSRILGLSNAARLTETGIRIDARPARELGLADGPAPEDEGRRRSLSGAMLDRLPAFAGGERRKPP
jgi:enoyl-CoA hydratase/carnithine racemase